MTFSIVARCQRTGMFGIAITSSPPAVAARCAHARAGVGAVATQNVTDPRIGMRGLDLLSRDVPAKDALDQLLSNDPTAAWRQVALVDRHDGVASFTGEAALGRHAVAEGKGAVAAGNLLSNTGVPAQMLDVFEASGGDLGYRLLTALQAGVSFGGEEGPSILRACYWCEKCRGRLLILGLIGMKRRLSACCSSFGSVTAPN
jgi:uncharacterized Ntn-hydrolase superfamily protein